MSPLFRSKGEVTLGEGSEPYLEAKIQVDRDHQRQGGKRDQVKIREPVLLLEPPKDEVQSHYASSTVRGATLPYVRQALSPRQKHV